MRRNLKGKTDEALEMKGGGEAKKKRKLEQIGGEKRGETLDQRLTRIEE